MTLLACDLPDVCHGKVMVHIFYQIQRQCLHEDSSPANNRESRHTSDIDLLILLLTQQFVQEVLHFLFWSLLYLFTG